MLRATRWIPALAAAVLAGTLLTAPAHATPPGIPSKATAQAQLNGITVAAQGSTSGYSRDLFPHWSTISGACNTRETVLRRDGTNVVTDSSCAATSGRWYSPYDGATWTAASDVDIDHVVPLAEAWRSGASGWTTSRRQAFANDLSRPQLIAVTDNVNQPKGDQDPASWQPPRTAYRCTYAKMWIAPRTTGTSPPSRLRRPRCKPCSTPAAADSPTGTMRVPVGHRFEAFDTTVTAGEAFAGGGLALPGRRADRYGRRRPACGHAWNSSRLRMAAGAHLRVSDRL